MKYGNSEPAQRLRNYINKLFFQIEMTEEIGYFIRADVATDNDIWTGYVNEVQGFMKTLWGPLQIPRSEESVFWLNCDSLVRTLLF